MRGTIARTSLAEVLSVPKFHVSRIRRRTESVMLRSTFRKVASLWATSMGASLGRRRGVRVRWVLDCGFTVVPTLVERPPACFTEPESRSDCAGGAHEAAGVPGGDMVRVFREL